MSDPAPPAAPKKRGFLKPVFAGLLGIGGGVTGMYTTAIVNKIAKPTLPVANFAVTADGLAVTCQNRAAGETGWWDFGDGSSLEPFAADQPAVTHTYAAPGTYAVKLTVRNFLAEENERSVPVTVAATGKDAPAAPQVLALAVQPVSPRSFAPATFRVTADVANADHCVWDFGDDRLEVTDGGGKIDRLVTFEKPGTFGLQLVAHNNKAAAKKTESVKVDAPVSGTLMAVLKVTDTGTRVDRITLSGTPTVSPHRENAAATFTKAHHPRPGYTFVSVTPVGPTPTGVKNLKVEVAADRRSATISGEWAADPKTGKPTGSVVLVPLRSVEERSVPTTPAAATVTGPFLGVPGQAGAGLASLPLPPVPPGLTGGKRVMVLEVRQVAASGPPRVIATAPLTPQPAGKPLWSATLNMGGANCRFQAAQEGDSVQVQYTTP